MRWWWELHLLCITVTQPLTHLNTAACGWMMNPEQSHALLLFKPATEQTFVCARLLSDIWYIAILSNCVVYFLTPTVSTIQFDATSSSWSVVFFLSAFIICDQKWSKPMLQQMAQWQLRQWQQHMCCGTWKQSVHTSPNRFAMQYPRLILIPSFVCRF